MEVQMRHVYENLETIYNERGEQACRSLLEMYSESNLLRICKWNDHNGEWDGATRKEMTEVIIKWLKEG